MIEPIWLPSLSHFTNGNGWSGSEGVLRFEIEMPKEDTVAVVLWQDPFTRKYAEELERSSFPVTEEGLSALSGWLTDRAEAMNASPPRTAQELQAWRDRVKANC